jgi:hypothetical protein
MAEFLRQNEDKVLTRWSELIAAKTGGTSADAVRTRSGLSSLTSTP